MESEPLSIVSEASLIDKASPTSSSPSSLCLTLFTSSSGNMNPSNNANRHEQSNICEPYYLKSSSAIPVQTVTQQQQQQQHFTAARANQCESSSHNVHSSEFIVR